MHHELPSKESGRTNDTTAKADGEVGEELASQVGEAASRLQSVRRGRCSSQESTAGQANVGKRERSGSGRMVSSVVVGLDGGRARCAECDGTHVLPKHAGDWCNGHRCGVLWAGRAGRR